MSPQPHPTSSTRGAERRFFVERSGFRRLSLGEGVSLRTIVPSTEENAVGADFHGAAVVVDNELTEGKHKRRGRCG